MRPVDGSLNSCHEIQHCTSILLAFQRVVFYTRAKHARDNDYLCPLNKPYAKPLARYALNRGIYALMRQYALNNQILQYPHNNLFFLFPTLLVLAIFLQQHSYFFVHFLNVFSFFFMLFLCKIIANVTQRTFEIVQKSRSREHAI